MVKMKLKIWQLGVVRVASPDSAPDGDTGQTLLPGYYLMLYLRGVVQSVMNSGVRYFGPFMTATEARFLQTSAVALGIVEPAVSIDDVLPTLDPQLHLLRELP